MTGLALDLAAARDPVAFAERVGLMPDGWQAEVLRSTASRLLLNCSRQSGKSSVTGILALWTAIYQPGSLILLLSPGERQSSELMRKVLGAYHPLAGSLPATAETVLRLELPNGSRIIALPGTDSTVRGYSGVRLLVVDEAARVEDGLYFAIRPMLAVSGGRLIALSTPWGRRGWWFRAWEEGQDWHRVHITAHQCPRIAPSFLVAERRALGAWHFEQDYLGIFNDADASGFSSDALAAAITPEVEPLPFGRPLGVLHAS